MTVFIYLSRAVDVPQHVRLTFGDQPCPFHQRSKLVRGRTGSFPRGGEERHAKHQIPCVLANVGIRTRRKLIGHQQIDDLQVFD